MAGGAGPCWIPAGSGLAQATWLVYPHLLQGDPCRIQCWQHTNWQNSSPELRIHRVTLTLAQQVELRHKIQWQQ